MKNQIKLAMFDLDGTLLDSIGDIVDGTNEMLGAFGREAVSRDEVCALIGAGARSLIEGALTRAPLLTTGKTQEPTEEEISNAIAVYISYNREHIAEKTRPYPGVPETLGELKARGITISLVSNKNVELCRHALRQFGLAEYFTTVIGGNSFAQKKPNPFPLRHAMTEACAQSAESIMVGDSLFDVQAGQNAGVATVGCLFGYGARVDIEKADYSIGRFSDLLALPPFRS